MEKLDLENVRVYTEEDVIGAMCLIGQDVYSSNYKDFSVYSKKEFIGVNYIVDGSSSTLYPFICQNKDGNERDSFRYFILAKDVKFKKEKKLRPYNDITEFWLETGCDAIGKDTITVRDKITKQESVLLYIGYSNDTVHLGGYQMTFKALLEIYEFYESYDLYDSNYDGGEWLPFGIEVNE